MVMRRRRTVPLGLADVARLPMPCRTCLFWELDDAAAAAVLRAGSATLEKEAWLSGVLLDNPSSGRLVVVDPDAPGFANRSLARRAPTDSDVAGFVIWAPPSQVPRAAQFPTGPVSADAVLLTVVHVVPAQRGAGVGRSLVRAAVGDLSRTGVRAIEAFASAGPVPAPCLVPAAFLLELGFREVAPHPRTPRLRLDVAAALPTFAEVEARLDRLRSALRPAPRRRRQVAGAPAPAPVPVRAAGQPASSDSRSMPVGASASAGR